jgi:hypothetical protein
MKGFLLSVLLICLVGAANCYAGDPIVLLKKTDKSLQRPLAYKPIVESKTNTVEPIVFKKFFVNKSTLGRVMQIGGGVLMAGGITLFQLYDSDGSVKSYIGMPLAFTGLAITLGGSYLSANPY